MYIYVFVYVYERKKERKIIREKKALHFFSSRHV